jgi:hypothetical protein
LQRFHPTFLALLSLLLGTACSISVEPKIKRSAANQSPLSKPSQETGVTVSGAGDSSNSKDKTNTGQPAPVEKLCDASAVGVTIQPGYEAFPGLADRGESEQVSNTTEEGCVSLCNNAARITAGYSQCTYRCTFGSVSLLIAGATSGSCSSTIASAKGAAGVNTGSGATSGSVQLASCEVRTRFGVFDGDFIGGNSDLNNAAPRDVCSSSCSRLIATAMERAGGSGCSYSCLWNASNLVTPFSSLSSCRAP